MSAPIRILHVDDDPELLELASEFIERADDALWLEVVPRAERSPGTNA